VVEADEFHMARRRSGEVTAAHESWAEALVGRAA